MEGTKSSHHDKMAQRLYLTYSTEWLSILALISDMERTNPLTMTEWLWVSSLSLGGNLDMENTKLLLEVLKLHPSQWLCQHINYLFICRNILELHCSPLHHIPDIVILDLDRIRLVMEPWVL